MFEKLDKVKSRYEEISELLSKPEVANDQNEYRKLTKEYSDLSEIVTAYDKYIEIKIELEKTEPQLSKEDEYLRAARKKGILRWDLNLSANTVDQSATVVKYSFTMEYDKSVQIQPRRLAKR